MPIETNNLISPEQIIDFPISDSVSYEYSFLSLQKLKMNTLENEMNLSIAKSRQLLDFVQAKYIGKSENLFEDNLSIGLGINLPFFGAARQDKSEFYFEKTVKESKLNNELKNKGFTVEEVPYAEIAKMEGLLRCSTLPLRRK